MFTIGLRRAAALWVGAVVLGFPALAAAEGEGEDGFPSWSERVIHQWINRARCDPQVEMDACGVCADGDCYAPTAPLVWSLALNRAARFHCANITDAGCGLRHNSPCSLVSDIDALYPDSCGGEVACACQPGTVSCAPTAGTSPWDRIALFGSIGMGENVAVGTDPVTMFYMWLFEPTSNPACEWRMDNGHRFNILRDWSPRGEVGVGVDGSYANVDFGGGPDSTRIPSGAHYPQTGSSIELWANWYDSEGPSSAVVNVGGTCHTMSLERGVSTNGAWRAAVSSLGSGCHRYYFEFEDADGDPVAYPTTGSLGIPNAAPCPDWSEARPAPCLEPTDSVFADGFENGTAGRWSSEVW